MFNPNDDVPDEDLDEETFNPNDDVPDEDLDEEMFNPNDDVPDEDLDEETFNPNDDVPDEDLDEEMFNPNDDLPDENPEEINNPNNSGTVTVVVPEEPEQTPEQESENEPEQDSEIGPENDPEQELERDWEIVTPEGEPEKPGEPPEVVEMRADLEEWGYPCEPDEDYSPPEPELDQTSDQEHENQPESESHSETEQEPEKEWEFINPETGEPVPKQVDSEMIPFEDKIEDIYREQQESPNEESNTVPEQQPESEPKQEPETEWESINPETDPELMPLNDQESEIIPEQELIRELEDIPELEPEQKPVKIQKKKPIKVKKVEVITDPEELGEYKPYKYEHIVGTPYDYKPEQEPKKKSSQKKKPVKAQKKKPIKVKKVEVITDPKELGDYEPNEYERIIGTRFYRPEQEPKKKPSQKKKPVKTQKKKQIKVKKIEAITDHEERPAEPAEKPIDTKKTSQTVQKKIVEKKEKTGEKEKEIKESETFLVNKTKSKQKTIQQIKAKAETKKQETKKSIEKPETKQMKRYRQETGKRPIYSGKKTKGFLEWLKNQKQPSSKKQVTNKKESKEDWEIILEKWINEFDEKEISKEIKKELINIVRKYRKSRAIYRKIIQMLQKKTLTKKETEEIEDLLKNLEKMTEIQAGLFKNLRTFETFYNENVIWFKHRIITQRKKFIKHLAQKLKNLKINCKTQKVIKKKWKEILKENLYKNTILNLNKKSIIIKILQKEKLTEDDKTELISILCKLPTEHLISLLGEDFRQLTQYYVRWGWGFDEGVKKLMLNNYFLSYNLYKYKKELTQASDFYTINKIKKFPRTARLIISLTIFNKLNENKPLQLRNLVKFLINSLIIKQDKSDWVKKIPNQELHQLSKKLHDKNQIIALELYFIDMIKLINALKCEIIRHKKTNDIFSIRSFVSKLIEKNINLGLSQRTLLSYISELIDYLNDHSNDFNIEKLSFQTLYDDGKRKECGQCHKIKSYTEFSKRSKNLLQSKCKKCRLEEAAIRNYKKKIRVLLRLLSSISKIKCMDCNTDLSRLSALELHHNDRKGKKVSFGDIYNTSLNRIIEALKSENITLLCANCHSKRQVKVFKKFKDIILKNNLFKNTSTEIDRIIDNYLKTFTELKQLTPSKISSFKTQIKRWLKKRYIIEQIYDGKCIGCGEINIKNNLPCFDFHHRNENLYEIKSRWTKINKFNIEKIIKILREEECIALCSNCHRIITHYRFIEHIDEILEKKYEYFKKKAKIIYKNIVNNINNFKFEETEIIDPFKKQIEYGEGWKKYIKAIFKLTQEKNDFQFTPNELASFLKLTTGSINHYLQKLLRLGLITLFKESERIKVGNMIKGATPRIYKLTDLGLQQFKNLD